MISLISNRTVMSTENVDMTAAQFFKLLEQPRVTAETTQAYKSLPLDMQSSVKDVGGYYGGETDGKRKVLNRSVITLDADHWGDLPYPSSINGLAAFWHTTRKHTEQNKRLRILVPLKEPIDVSEYEKVSRYVANMIGMHLLDSTTHQPNRLMFLPSVSCDQDYKFGYIEGVDLDVKALNLSDDPATWHYHEGENASKRPNAKGKQIHPFDKTGVIGCFNRQFSITNVLETWLDGVYQPFKANRYTYSGSTSVGGVVVYDDMFLYSHHESDPAHLKLLSAFDLVRVHLHKGDFKETMAWALEIKGIKEQLRLEAASKQQLIVADQNALKSDDWQNQLRIDKFGSLVSNLNNLALICSNDTTFKLAYNAWTNVVECNDEPINDVALSEISRYFEAAYINKVPIDSLHRAVELVAHRNTYNPLKDYLGDLQWDGVERVSTLFHDYLGADNNELTQFATRMFFTAAIKRVFEAGCKYDQMLILVGKQGLGKSMIMKHLAGRYFTDNLPSFNSKEALESIEKYWIVEVAELAAVNRSDVETLKAFISRQTDTVRKAYARYATEHARRCVFIGTTNSDEIFTDTTGNRRFIPIMCKEQVVPMDKEFGFFTEYERDMIWAEAMHLYQTEHPTHLDDELLTKLNDVNNTYLHRSDMASKIEEFLDVKVPKNLSSSDFIAFHQEWLLTGVTSKETFAKTTVTVAEVWEGMGFSLERFNRAKRNEIELTLISLGWERGNIKRAGKTYRGYRKKE